MPFLSGRAGHTECSLASVAEHVGWIFAGGPPLQPRLSGILSISGPSILTRGRKLHPPGLWPRVRRSFHFRGRVGLWSRQRHSHGRRISTARGFRGTVQNESQSPNRGGENLRRCLASLCGLLPCLWPSRAPTISFSSPLAACSAFFHAACQTGRRKRGMKRGHHQLLPFHLCSPLAVCRA